MHKLMNTFSANSLKILEKSEKDFIDKYIARLDFINKTNSAKTGEKLHGLISYYLRGFDVDKIKNSLSGKERELVEKAFSLEIFKEREKFIKIEETFLVKCGACSPVFYLTGRFDAIFKDGEKYTIYDWKSKNIPENPAQDLQSIVYLYCASKIFDTENLSIKYISLEDTKSCEAGFENAEKYLNKILKIVKKLPPKYLT